jgi:hypothetical protein
MTVRLFLVGAIVTSVFAWGICLLIVNWIDPQEAGWTAFILFFLALFLAVAATSGLIGYSLRRLLQPRQLAAYRVRPSLRQGLWLALFLDLLLFLQLQRLLRWWITVILVVFFLSVELLFLTYDRNVQHHRAAEKGSNPEA